MTWTYTTRAAQQLSDGNVSVPVDYFLDGIKKFTDDYRPLTDVELKQTVRNKLAELEGRSSLVGVFTGGAIDLTPPPPPTPPVIDPNKVLYETSIAKLRRFKEAVDNGVITTADPSYVAALADTKAKFNASYLG